MMGPLMGPRAIRFRFPRARIIASLHSPFLAVPAMLILLVATLLPCASAWSAAGHLTTAAVAEALLSPVARATVQSDLAAYASLYPNESTITDCAVSPIRVLRA